MESEKILYTEGIVKKFGGLVAVDNADIYLKKNEILGLIGANGAGKTTLFNMIRACLLPRRERSTLKGSIYRASNLSRSASWGSEGRTRLCSRSAT